MPRVARAALEVAVVLLGLLHVQFSIPNFAFSGECTGSGFGWLTSCTVLYEALLALLAGLALLAAAALLHGGRAVTASAVALAGTAPLCAFFWLVAVPTGLSDRVFGVMSTPVPAVAAGALAASLLVRARRAGRPAAVPAGGR